MTKDYAHDWRTEVFTPPAEPVTHEAWCIESHHDGPCVHDGDGRPAQPVTDAGKAHAHELKRATVFARTADRTVATIEAQAVKPWREVAQAVVDGRGVDALMKAQALLATIESEAGK